MTNDKYFWELQRTLSAEFSKFILAHPDLDGQIPNNSQIVFHIKDNLDFNKWSERVNRAQRESNQPVVIVGIDDLAPPLESRLINPHLEVASK